MAKTATLQERLIQLFDADPRTDSAIGDMLGVSKQTVSAWRNGSRSPKKSMVVKIAHHYNTSEEWLMGWDLPTPGAPANTVTLNNEEMSLLLAYRAADDRARDDAMHILSTHQKGGTP